jgi:hypothetical protein
MGHSDQMQKSLNYTRGLRQKRNYYQDKVFDAKWGDNVGQKLPKKQKPKLLAPKNRSELYLKEMKANSRKGLLVGASVILAMAYYFLRYILN